MHFSAVMAKRRREERELIARGVGDDNDDLGAVGQCVKSFFQIVRTRVRTETHTRVRVRTELRIRILTEI